jgi:hypothetical protein
MTEIDKFFDDAFLQVKLDSRVAVREAARELEADVKRQIRRNFRNPSIAFQRGLKVHDYEYASYVRLSPILSAHAQKIKIEGNPNLWILLPDGARLGFKRIGKGFSWTELKRRYGSRLSFVPVSDGSVVLFRSNSGFVPIYKIQRSVETTQRIEFYEKATEIASKYGTTTSKQ